MISIPQTIAKRFGIPDRGEYGRRLLGRGKDLTHGGNVIQELIIEREAEG